MPDNNKNEIDKLIKNFLLNKEFRRKQLALQTNAQTELLRKLAKNFDEEKFLEERIKEARNAADAFIDKCHIEWAEFYKNNFGD